MCVCVGVWWCVWLLVAAVVVHVLCVAVCVCVCCVCDVVCVCVVCASIVVGALSSPFFSRVRLPPFAGKKSAWNARR